MKFIVEVNSAYHVEAGSRDEAFDKFLSSPLEDFECDWEEVVAVYGNSEDFENWTPVVPRREVCATPGCGNNRSFSQGSNYCASCLIGEPGEEIIAPKVLNGSDDG